MYIQNDYVTTYGLISLYIWHSTMHQVSLINVSPLYFLDWEMSNPGYKLLSVSPDLSHLSVSLTTKHLLLINLPEYFQVLFFSGTILVELF